MALQRTFGKIPKRQEHGKVNCVIITAINTDNSFLCAKVWHIRENCRYFLFTQCCESTATYVRRGTLRGAITQKTDLSRVDLVVKIPTILCKLFGMVEFISTSLSLLFLASLEYYRRGKTSPFQK